MPRLSLWREDKGNDYHFIDGVIKEQFFVGGTGILIHKYLGPQETGPSDDPSQPNNQASGTTNETSIQDILFLENRDRKYDPDIYELRGHYNVNDNDFDLTQFGLFLSNDTIYLTFHINDMVEKIGRKLMSGDVIELPHLRDDLLLSEHKEAINRWYVVEDGSRPAEGFSPTWWPHIWRIKAGPIADQREFRDILGDYMDENSIKNKLSTYGKEIEITDAILEAAAKDNANNSKDTAHLFNYDPDNPTYEHGETIPTGSAFPNNPNQGVYFLRTDYMPDRLFVRQGDKWHRVFDNVLNTTWEGRTFPKAKYFNNEGTALIDGKEYESRQPLSEVIKPKTDA